MQTVLVTTSSFAKQDPAPLKLLQDAQIEVILNPYERKLSEDEVLGLITKYKPVGILAGIEPLTERVLGEAEGLKTIARAGIGMDSVDLIAAEKLNITVTNTPDAPTIPVAELTVGMMLGLLRQVHKSDESIRLGAWKRPMGRLLFKKNIGIIGCGRIGSQVARILKSFGCSIFGCDVTPPLYDQIQMLELNHLLPQCDIITLHLPYTPETHHIIDHSRLQKFRKGAYLINASRGGLVDESALYESLQAGHLAGAALDCFEQEPYTGPLKDLKNTLLTAHIGSYAKEGRVMMEIQAAQNLLGQLKTSEVPA